VTDYRTFRNTDPPGLVHVWNGSRLGRGAAPLRDPTLLEYFSLAKPYFDPAGLVVATEDGHPVGFAHAGFGPAAGGSALDTGVGVVCLVVVLPGRRRQGVGSELLRRCELYLGRRGARELVAGPREGLNPFTFGLYGGCRSAGFLDSDAQARPFLEHRGYVAREAGLVFQRDLDRAVSVADGRFPAHRQRYQIEAGLATGLTWWQECVLGPVELHEYVLTDRSTGQTAARATLWEMDTYNRPWNQHAVGIVGLEVLPALRRQGLARFLLAQMLRHFHEQFFTLVEAHAPGGDEAAVNLLRGLGFEQVDTGRSYGRRTPAPEGGGR
jgi:ribosomal protein S18 acetylase RimI-like enzyme